MGLTDDELRKPGVAWEEAKKALDLGDIVRARELTKYMVHSDRKLMNTRIEARIGAEERN